MEHRNTEQKEKSPKLLCKFCNVIYMSIKTFDKHNGKCFPCRRKEDKEKRVLQDRKKPTKQQRQEVWSKLYMDKNTGICYICEKNIITLTNYVIGHKQAVAKGGISDLDNYFPICSECNSKMGTEHMDEYYEKIKNQRIKNITKIQDNMVTILNMYIHSLDKQNKTFIDAECQTDDYREDDSKFMLHVNKIYFSGIIFILFYIIKKIIG
jgi:hypothetical protein